MAPSFTLPRSLASAIAVLVIGLPMTIAAPTDWVGSEACRDCHADAYAAWKTGPHAAATASLAGDKKRIACLGCHTTGEAPAGRALFDGVGCEACHGAGAGYAKADIMADPPLSLALGLASVGTPAALEALCLRCHQDNLRLTPFEVGAAWKRLPHGRAAAARSRR